MSFFYPHLCLSFQTCMTKEYCERFKWINLKKCFSQGSREDLNMPPEQSFCINTVYFSSIELWDWMRNPKVCVLFYDIKHISNILFVTAIRWLMNSFQNVVVMWMPVCASQSAGSEMHGDGNGYSDSLQILNLLVLIAVERSANRYCFAPRPNWTCFLLRQDIVCLCVCALLPLKLSGVHQYIYKSLLL